MLDVSNQQMYWRIAKIGIGLDKVEPGKHYIEQWRRHFKTFSSMPKLTQERVAMLAMAVGGERIEGLGRKVSPNTFWLDDNAEMLAEYKETK